MATKPNSSTDPSLPHGEKTFDPVMTSRIFQGLDESGLAMVRARMTKVDLPPGDVILAEGKVNRRIFIIEQGRAEVVRIVEEGGAERSHRLSEMGPGEEFGEVSVVDGGPVSATVRAMTEMTLWIVDFGEVQDDPELTKLHDHVTREFGRKIASRLRRSSRMNIEMLEKEVQAERLRTTKGLFIMVMLCLFSAYTIFSKALLEFEAEWFQTYGTPIVIVLFMTGVSQIIRRSPLPRSFFGITLTGAFAASKDAALWSLVAIGALIGGKAVFLSLTPENDMELFTLAEMFVVRGDDGSVNWTLYCGAVVLYAAFCPAQELLARCGVQAPLFEFLALKSERKRHLISVLVSNLVFSASHMHLGFGFAIATFIPGLFWGWLFARHRSLIGVSVSHILVGSFALFALGIEDFLG